MILMVSSQRDILSVGFATNARLANCNWPIKRPVKRAHFLLWKRAWGFMLVGLNATSRDSIDDTED